MAQTAEITPEIRKQIADQYRAVVHMARALADVHADLWPAIEAGHCDQILSIQGPRSASIMDRLGDILNGMDANDEADSWLDPVFDAAHKLFGGDGATTDNNLGIFGAGRLLGHPARRIDD
jgi:hypothetical protein